MIGEPPQLIRGRAFERLVKSYPGNQQGGQFGWLHVHEKTVMVGGRRRRIDVLIDPAWTDEKPCLAVAEIKSCDWERMKPERVLVNVKRHARQVYRYVDGCPKGQDVAPAILYETTPRDDESKRAIEDFLDSQCIQVIWADELDSPAWGFAAEAQPS